MTKIFDEITDEIILRAIMNHSEDMICFKDRDSRIIVSSQAYALLRGEKSNRDIRGKTDFDYFTHDMAMQTLKDEISIINTGRSKVGMVERVVKPDGSIIWLSVEKHPLYDRDNSIIGSWGVFRDITYLKDAEQEFINLNKRLEYANAELENLSARDSLSGLFNQGHFFEKINDKFELNKRRSESVKVKGFSLIIFDVDDFKTINDIYGHLMGDSTIRHISNLIQCNTRISDICFRYGGDEFAIILTDTCLRDARKVAEKLRQTIENTPIKMVDEEVTLTVSMGVSSFNEVSGIEEMIKLADARLYYSKNKGKNRVC